VTLAVIVGLAGGLGAVLRHLVNVAFTHRAGMGFPWSTLVVNAIGSAVLGLLAGVMAAGTASETVLGVVGAGLCGGLTTWSAAAWETVKLAGDRRRVAAAGFALANLALSLGSAAGLFAVGVILVR
jgi:fluoride exporter